MADPIRVFWQPGCSSCLKAKEFLTEHGIAFDSVNVLADANGFDDLQALGAKSVPVVSRGTEFVFAQNLGDVAAFVGVERNSTTLQLSELISRLGRVLVVAQSHARQMPNRTLATQLPGRDRTYLDLAYHIFVIAEGFLEAAKGGELTFEFFERRPPSHLQDGVSVSEFGQVTRDAVSTWWADSGQGRNMPESLRTYYGTQSLSDLLERSAWHAAQHTRQLERVLEDAGVVLSDTLTAEDVAGLPLPDHVYDDEVPLATEAR